MKFLGINWGDFILRVLDCIVTISFGVYLVLWLFCFVMCGCVCVCGCFGNMCTCIYCVLYCLYCVFCIVSFMYIYSYLFCLY